MKVVESIRGAMDAFDAFYDSTSRQETDDAKRKAIATIVRSKGDWGTPKGLEVLAAKLTDLVVSSMEETRAMTGPEVGQLVLAVLGTDPASVDSTMRRRILLDRLEQLVGEAADEAKLFPAKQTEEWGSHDLVYTREIDGWDVTLGYFPEYLRAPGDLRPRGRLPAGQQDPRHVREVPPHKAPPGRKERRRRPVAPEVHEEQGARQAREHLRDVLRAPAARELPSSGRPTARWGATT